MPSARRAERRLTVVRPAAANPNREARVPAGAGGPRGPHHPLPVGAAQPHAAQRGRGRQRAPVGRGGALRFRPPWRERGGSVRRPLTPRPQTGKQLVESREHKKQVQDLQLSADGTHFVTASIDKTAKVFDSATLDCLKTFSPERPVNAAVLSPIFDHVIVGGGQDAMSVTLTSSKAGKFESKIYHKVFGDEIGGIKGHFGPINALAIHPDGRSFTSGGALASSADAGR